MSANVNPDNRGVGPLSTVSVLHLEQSTRLAELRSWCRCNDRDWSRDAGCRDRSDFEVFSGGCPLYNDWRQRHLLPLQSEQRQFVLEVAECQCRRRYRTKKNRAQVFQEFQAKTLFCDEVLSQVLDGKQ